MAAKKTTANQEQKSKKAEPVSHKPDYSTHIVVKFQDYVDLPYHKGVEKQIEEFRVGPWEKLAKEHPGISIQPLFGNINQDKLKGLVAKARQMDPTYKGGDFFRYFRVTCPVESDPGEILGELSSWNNVRNAYFKPAHIAPGLVNYGNNPQANAPAPYQDYLDLAPAGISAKYVWDAGTPGSDGTGINFIDVEQGWKLDHSDLPSPAITLISGNNLDASKSHGTSVLGIICAVDNLDKCVGIAPKAAGRVISSDPNGVGPAIVESLLYLNFGDILLIEETNIESDPTSAYYNFEVPVETTDAEFDAIRLATALGIIVIEPGGNGNGVDAPVNLDDYTKKIGGVDTQILNRSKTVDFKDSGAIIITASENDITPVSTHDKLVWTPYGTRIDCYAWGESIVTLSTDATGTTSDWTFSFGGTSGAAAIIAGAVLSMQGMALARVGGYRLSPGQIRAILQNGMYGTDLSTPVPPPGHYYLYGIYMPDLEKYADLCLNAYPDLYMRDFVGDTGEPHAGAISCSPDIILKNNPLTAPQTPQDAFGESSSTVDDAYLNDTAKIGQSNYLYARVRNRGGAPASGVTVQLFYGVPSTLVTPNMLTSVGAPLTFPGDVPTGNILTVSDEYTWTPSGSAGHYCFVGLVSNPQDPTLDLTQLKSMTWDQYYQFIRANNNITWRNFDMILPPPPSPTPPPPVTLPKKKWRIIEFVSPGLPKIPKVMHLEVIAYLPEGGEAVIQLPCSLNNAIPKEIKYRVPEFWKRDINKSVPVMINLIKDKASLIPVNPDGTTMLNETLFPADSVNKIKLYVYVPEKFENQQYTIAVRQMLEGNEVGRVTWRLVPPVKKGFIPEPRLQKRRK